MNNDNVKIDGSIRLTSIKRFGWALWIDRSLDGGWRQTVGKSRLIYKLCLCRFITYNGVKCWILYIGNYKIHIGKTNQKL